MAINSISTSKNPDVWIDGEINLRYYVYLLIDWWREIVVFALVAAVLAILGVLLMRLVLPPQYIATASVAIVRTSTNVTLDERFRTTADVLGENATNVAARRNALLGLVATGTIAQMVSDELQGILDDKNKIPANLLKLVSAVYAVEAADRSGSDLINIVVTADAPEKAAAIANAWAKNYIKEVNRIYGEVPTQVVESIKSELTTTRQDYLDAQASLTKFTANNRLNELNALTTILQQQIAQEVSLQQALLLQWQQTQEQLTTAKALRKQIELGGNGAARTTMAAVQTLKIAAYGMASAQLQLEIRDLPQVTAEELLVDLDGLIAAHEGRLQDLATKIATTSETLGSDDAQTNPLQSTIVTLRVNQAQLEEEQARQRQLVQQRDVKWEAFQALSGKLSELSLAQAAASSEVRLGASAVPPAEATKRVSLLISTIIATGAGLSIGVFYTLLAALMNKPPFLAKLRRPKVALQPTQT